MSKMEIKDERFAAQTIAALTDEARRSAQRCGRPVYVMREGPFVWYSTMKVTGPELLEVVTPGSYSSKMAASKLYVAPEKRKTGGGFSMFPSEQATAPRPKPAAPTERAPVMHDADVGAALTRMMKKD